MMSITIDIIQRTCIWMTKPKQNISLVEVKSLWTLSQITSSFANKTCWHTSGTFCKVWAYWSGLMSTRGISWSSSMSGAKSFCSSGTLSKLALLGTIKVPLKFSMSFTKSRRFHFIMDFRSKSRRFHLIMELRSMPAICLSFTEPCRFRLFLECRHLRSISALLGAERLGHSQGNWPRALLWKHKVLCQACWSLTYCGL